VCKKVVCDKEGAAEEAGPRRDGGGGYRIKNKNPTQRCGEKASLGEAKITSVKKT